MTQPTPNSPFFSRNSIEVKDNPLSPNGRFNRLSYLGWYGFLNIVTVIVYLALGVFVGVFSLNTFSINDRVIDLFSGAMGVGVVILWVVVAYFHIVFLVRRLHDANRSGWLCLLLLIPIVQFLFMLYVIFAPGSKGFNDYGAPRSSAVWEKILAWLMIIVMILSLFSIASLISFMSSTGELQSPTQIVQKGTSYF
ncbi:MULTISPECIES: DUF805 domain-containing protein [unclassified Acinetobacter]|uniref:DUF805 domain-containing protein n=1 Tax=unclassified Acinetobacter TaxID=196816 RepID=UPI00190D1B9C|nr:MULTISPECIES: DUF805 domain-containing protein [unclassified Acinetobacter]MBK0063495.1 DUF805 domain-containing protein [Acinetobacter sp. S55]MBK0065434.1 DUF805 domain-containing protein [Acinetobacter sp. S54]